MVLHDFDAYSKLTDILSVIDAEKYPETYQAIINSVDTEAECVTEDLYDLATELYHADETEPMFSIVSEYLQEYYETETGNGNAGAANDLGSLYYTGRIGEQNYTKAFIYYNIAAENGDRAAQENLGYCYYYGRNVEKNYAKAFHYFALGAFDGHLISLYKIGDMYKNGYYVKKNEKEAFLIYEHCLAMLSDESVRICGADIYMRMADCLAKGIGTDVNYNDALMFYQRAEQLFYIRINDGDHLVRNSCKHCVETQEEIRKKIQETLPKYGWTNN